MTTHTATYIHVIDWTTNTWQVHTLVESAVHAFRTLEIACDEIAPHLVAMAPDGIELSRPTVLAALEAYSKVNRLPGVAPTFDVFA